MSLPYPLEPLRSIRSRPDKHVHLFCYAALLEFLLDTLHDKPRNRRTIRTNARNLLAYQ